MTLVRPPYKRKVWDYKTAKTNSIRKDLSNINWQTLFLNLNVNEMSLVFADTFLSIFSQHISNKIITCNDKDAPWITPKVKSAIRRNSRVYRKWVKRGKKHDDHDKVREVQNSTNSRIRQAKQAHYVKLGNILSNPQTGHKNFWPAFKRVTNKKNILIFRPSLITISLLPIFNIKLIYLTTILPTNATFTIMAALYRNFVPKQMRRYLSLTLLLTKL